MTTTIDKSRVDRDIDGDGYVERWERDLVARQTDPMQLWRADTEGRRYRRGFEDLTSRLDAAFSRAGDAYSPADATAEARMNALLGRMEGLRAAIEQARASGESQRVAVLEQQLQQLNNRAQVLERNMSPELQRYEAPQREGQTSSVTLAMTAEESEAGAGRPRGSGTGAKAATIGRGAAGPKATTFSPPAGWGVKAMDVGDFNSAAFLQAQATTDDMQKAWDDINANTQRGKQLMMLFFYFARMAESGDLGAMYQFMKFITYIISKDKAKQQIEMGKKLIQLQDLSRKWTNKLLDLQSNSADPSASSELMKLMTIVKSETDAIATSQKLISQMMEEFAQVVETLTNTTKAALEAYGRVMRTVSTIR